MKQYLNPVWSSLILCFALVAACGHKAGPEADGAKPAATKDAKEGAKGDGGADAKDEGGKPETAERQVKLSPEDVEKTGIKVTAAVAAEFRPEVEGFGVVLGHDAIASAVADVTMAEAMARQSRAVLARIERLAGTPGADTDEAREAAQRQAAVDAASLQLARRKLTTVVGENPPWAGTEASGTLGDLASGRAKLLRVTFPLGALPGGAPQDLRAARLDAPAAEQQWRAHGLWDAPADGAVPGRSFFALLPQGRGIAEGERLTVWASGGVAGPSVAGVLVPAAAAVVRDGRYWCYVERAPGEFERVPLDISRPRSDGYVVVDVLKPGDQLVSSGSGLLLARETNPSTAADE